MVSGYPTSTNSPWVDGLSTDPQDLGCHRLGVGNLEMLEDNVFYEHLYV